MININKELLGELFVQRDVARTPYMSESRDAYFETYKDFMEIGMYGPAEDWKDGFEIGWIEAIKFLTGITHGES